MCICDHGGLKSAFDSPEAQVICGCEPPDTGTENQTSIAEGPSAFNTEPSLQDLDLQNIFPKMVML